jgi:hypothetical protein
VKDQYLLTPEASAGSVSRWNWCILSHLLIYVFYIFSPIIIYIINIYSPLYPWVAVYIYVLLFLHWPLQAEASTATLDIAIRVISTRLSSKMTHLCCGLVRLKIQNPGFSFETPGLKLDPANFKG